MYAKHVVVGVGAEPSIPQPMSTNSRALVHVSSYLYHHDTARRAGAVTVIYFGRANTEIFIDLVEANLCRSVAPARAGTSEEFSRSSICPT